MTGEIEKLKEEFKKIKLPQHMRFYDVDGKFIFERRSDMYPPIGYKWIYYLVRINWKKKTVYVIAGGFKLVAIKANELINKSGAIISLENTIAEFKKNPEKYKRDWSILDGGDLGLPWNEQ